MKYLFFSILIFSIEAILCPLIADSPLNAVSYSFSGGRFGDNLIAYMHAKWIAHRYQMKLLYKSFPYSDQLAMHSLESHYNFFSRNYIIKGIGSPKEYETSQNVLFIIPYFPEASFEQAGSPPPFAIERSDREFRDELNKMIFWPEFVPQIEIPVDRISVAVHVRKGVGFDYRYPVDQKMPPFPITVSKYCRFIIS